MGQPSSKDIIFFATNLPKEICKAALQGGLHVLVFESEVALVLSGPSGPNRERLSKAERKLLGLLLKLRMALMKLKQHGTKGVWCKQCKPRTKPMVKTLAQHKELVSLGNSVTQCQDNRDAWVGTDLAEGCEGDSSLISSGAPGMVASLGRWDQGKLLQILV